MPSRALSGRDPQNGKNGFSIPHGFTVIEMMIALAVLAIITSLALPSYRAILEKRKVTSAAEQAMAFLSSAQMEAVKRNQIVAVNFETYTVEGTVQWCLGMIAGDAPLVDCECSSNTCELDGAAREFHSTSLNYPAAAPSIDAAATQFGDGAIGADGTLRFDPIRGVTRDSDTVDLALISPDQDTYALNVGVGPTGRVKICSSNSRASKFVPGYEEC